MSGHSYLIVRGASLYITVVVTAAVWVWRRPAGRTIAAAALASAWNVPVLLALNVAAVHVGWWQFDAGGGLLLGVPVDLFLSWVWVWGAMLALAFPAGSLGIPLLVALGADLVLMPAASPVVRLGPWWVVGEMSGLVAGILPGQLLARWTSRDERLGPRVVLQVLAFTAMLFFVLPAIIIEGSGGTWIGPASRPVWQLSLLAQALAVPALLGLTAVQEFLTVGAGTPVPFDPPRRLVTTGIYAYLRNPMQLSAVVLLFLLGLVLKNPWVSAAGVMAHLYSAGLAGWDEDEDLRQRFEEDWMTYRHSVRAWIPRFRPWYRNDRPSARLFVEERCGMCHEVGQWFERRGARGLAVVPAETHPSRSLMRVTYETGGGVAAATGVAAVARALEHIHLGWALVGWVLRLPVICPFAQLLTDASGGEPRRFASTGHCHGRERENEKTMPGRGVSC